MKKILLFAAAALVLAACTNDENSYLESPGQVMISPVLTKATDTAFEEGDQIGLSITVDDELYASNECFTYADGLFTGQIYWYSGTDLSTVFAYYPYDETGVPTSFTVSTDQTGGTSDSDFIAGVLTDVTPSEAALVMSFSHQLSKIVVNITNETDNSIEAVKLCGSFLTAAVDVETLSATASETSEIGDITLYEATAGLAYCAIVVPQTISFGLTVVTSSGELSTNTETATLKQGAQYTINVSVQDDDISVFLSGEIEDWTEDGEIGGGEEDETEMTLIFSETFGSAGSSHTLVNSSSTLYQLAKYYTGFCPDGDGSASVAYWSGLRVDLRQNTFQTDEEETAGTDNSYVYFGNTNNNYVGGSGTITDIEGYTACADVNDRLSLYIYNVNVGTNCTKAQLSFDVKINDNSSSVGETAWTNAVESLIDIAYTTDGGYSWIDASNPEGTTVNTSIYTYYSEEMDLSGYSGEFVTFRIKATMKQTLNIDNLALYTLGSDNIVGNCAPSVTQVYRQTPTTAYLECRPAAGTPLTESQIQTVVPYVGTAGGTLTEWTEFEIRNIDETYQVFEMRLDGLSTTGADLNVALSYNGQVGGVTYFQESPSNEIFNVTFDRFTAGSNPVESLSRGWIISGSVPTYASPDGTNSSYYSNYYNRQMDLHDPTLREEKFPTFSTDSNGKIYCSSAKRGGNNMEAAWRAEFSSNSNSVTTGSTSAGNFFRYDCELYGWTGLLLYELEGCLQVGTGSTTAWDGSSPTYLCTPAIGEDYIPSGSTATVNLSFGAAMATINCTKVDVVRVEGSTQTVLGTYEFSSYDQFETISVTVDDATCDTQFLIGPTSGSASGSARLYLDNIKLTL